MAVDYPYAIATGKIPLLFNRIATVGKPSKVDINWLKSVGLTSSNDARLVPLLRHIGFIDGSKSPTDFWQQYRGQNGQKILAAAIRSAYSDLFHTYPQAHQASVEDLSNFVRSNTDLGTEAVSKVVTTFRSLAELADFSGTPGSSNGQQQVSRSEDAQLVQDDDAQEQVKNPRNLSSGVVINVNLQLPLPETTDPKVYDALFSALNKHILVGASTSE